jgi:hypothetical protein
MSRLSDLWFLAGKPWRRKHRGDPPDLDYSMCDDYVCPIHLYIGGRQEEFVTDATVTDMAFTDRLPEDRARMKAEVIADALNRQISDPEWRDRNLRYLIEPNAGEDPV